MKYTLIHGDCLEEMRKMPDCSIDFIVTDPPYMIDFMGKKFDKFNNNPAANPDLWAEALRICKPGSMLAAFGGDRTHHHLMIALEQAGWEIRTCIYWLYGSGFPKSHNFGKQLNEDWHGYGTALKPAAEICVLAMKPLDGTFAQNAEKWGVAGINIDDSRILTKDRWKQQCQDIRNNALLGKKGRMDRISQIHEKGRWPANIILDEEAAQQLDQQAGITASRFFYCAKASKSERNVGLEGMPFLEKSNGNKWTDQDYRVIKGERPISAQSVRRQNHHPTVKPIALMKYILKLLAPLNDPIVLDPFLGSGTTCLAAEELGIRSIGIEKELEYFTIAKERLKSKNIQQELNL